MSLSLGCATDPKARVPGASLSSRWLVPHWARTHNLPDSDPWHRVLTRRLSRLRGTDPPLVTFLAPNPCRHQPGHSHLLRAHAAGAPFILSLVKFLSCCNGGCEARGLPPEEAAAGAALLAQQRLSLGGEGGTPSACVSCRKLVTDCVYRFTCFKL